MKKGITYLFLLVGVSLFAQKLTNESLKSSQLKTYKKVVKQSLYYNDLTTTVNNLHHIIALEGSNSSYKDSLAIVYFTARNYTSSEILSRELLKRKPANTQLLEINAVSLQSLGAIKQSIETYEKLFPLTKSMGHGYQLATLQYGLKRLVEAQATIVKSLACKEIEGAKLRMQAGENKSQNIPLKAVIYNLKGLIEFELNNHESSKEAFNMALKLSPEFVLAKQNIKSLEEVDKGEK